MFIPTTDRPDVLLDQTTKLPSASRRTRSPSPVKLSSGSHSSGPGGHGLRTRQRVPSRDTWHTPRREGGAMRDWCRPQRWLWCMEKHSRNLRRRTEAQSCRPGITGGGLEQRPDETQNRFGIGIVGWSKRWTVLQLGLGSRFGELGRRW